MSTVTVARTAERHEAERSGARTVVTRLQPVSQRAPYVGLYGNHPYQVAARHEVRLPALAPEDFED